MCGACLSLSACRNAVLRFLVCALSLLGMALFSAAVADIGEWRAQWSRRMVNVLARRPSALQRWLLSHADAVMVVVLVAQALVIGAALMAWLEGTPFLTGTTTLS